MAKRRRHRGEGSIRERSPGVWQVRLNHDGTALTRTVHGNRRDATAALTKLHAEADRLASRPAEIAAYTVRDLYEAWWRSPTIAAPGTKKTPSTLHTHDSFVRNWIGPHLGHIPLAKLSARDIEKMVVAQQAKGLKVSSIRRCIATLRLMLKQAMKWDWIDANPLDKTTLDSVRTGHITPPPTEAVGAVIEASRHITGPHADTLPVLTQLLAATGMRKGEACGLQWRDVNWRGEYITINRNVTYTPKSGVQVGPTKNKRSRVVLLEPAQMDVLNGLYQLRTGRGPVTPDHWVFGPGDGSQPITPAALATAYDKARKAAGTTLGLHGFRHWHATQLLNVGVPIKSVQERLGHSHASTTMNIYAHPVEATARVAAKEVAQLMAQFTIAPPATPGLPPATAAPPDGDEF